MKRVLWFAAAFSLAALSIARGADSTVVTVQLLDYENGYVFFTTGDGFKVAPGVAITDIASGKLAAPFPREYARVTFDESGTVTKIELSKVPLPPEGDLANVRKFAIALSTPQPNPELAPRTGGGGRCFNTRAGKSVVLSVTVQVPPTTPQSDSVYMTTDQSGWNPQAYRLDRTDVLHYRLQLRLLSGTVMHVLFDRGSLQTMEVGQNGIEQAPYAICIGDEDAQAFTRTIYRWADQQLGAALPSPGVFPTPYNPNPFPGFPTAPPPPTPTPHP